MLFAVKRHLVPTLLLLVLFIGGGWAGREALGLQWHWQYHAGLPLDLLLGLTAMAASDGTGFGLLAWLLRERFLARYRGLVEYFRSQGAAEIVAGGLLAGGEELVFRGVLLEGLRSRAGVPSAVAVAIAAVVFGLLHWIPSRLLAPFVFWAVWEGALLGIVYVLSDSLTVVVVLHILHDMVGFSLFALQRKTGWLV